MGKYLDKLARKTELPEVLHKRIQRKLARAKARIEVYETLLKLPVKKDTYKVPKTRREKEAVSI